MRRTQAGESVLMPRSTREENQIERVAENYEEQKRLSPGGAPKRSPTPTDVVDIRNDTGRNLGLGQLCRLGGRTLSAGLESDYMMFEGLMASRVEFLAGRTHGVMLDATAKDDYGRCQLSGICLAQVQVGSLDDIWAQIGPVSGYDWIYEDNSESIEYWNLTSQSNRGPVTFAQIIEELNSSYTPAGEDYMLAIRILPPPQPSLIYKGIADEDIASGATGTVSIWAWNVTGSVYYDTGENVEATNYWANSRRNITEGKEVWVILISDEQDRRWQVIGAECE